MCPNPGSAANLVSKRQRLQFVTMDRTDPYSILDVGKVADIVLVIMSCAKTTVATLHDDPLKNSDGFTGAT